MVQVTNSKIVIEIEDKAPVQLLNNFKISIIEVLQNLDFQTQAVDQLETSHYFLLKLLKELVNEEDKSKIS